jgi:predicted nucleic acid-binding protein
VKSVAADSGPLLALFNRADAWNSRVLAWLEANPGARLFTTWPVVTEVCALLSKRIGDEAALDFLLWIERGGLILDRPAPGSFHDALAISQKYKNVPFDFADASVAELAARRGMDEILTIDSDFDIYRDARGKALRNVLRSTAWRR